MKERSYAAAAGNRKIGYVFGLTLFFLALTGFAQMPIFKRYYIADIPGLGWLAEFYTTHFIHYLAAVILLAVAGYAAADFLLAARGRLRLSAAGAVRSAILGGIIVSGILLVIRNTFFVPFSPGTITVLLLLHMGLTMVYLVFALYCRLSGRPWTRVKP